MRAVQLDEPNGQLTLRELPVPRPRPGQVLVRVAGRGHSLTIDSGWRELAEYCLAWLKGKGL